PDPRPPARTPEPWPAPPPPTRRLRRRPLSATFLASLRPSNLPTFRPSDLPTFRPSDVPTFRPSDLHFPPSRLVAFGLPFPPSRLSAFPPLLLALQNPGARAYRFLPKRPPRPLGAIDRVAARHVRLEVGADARGDGLAVKRDVHLVVVLERSVVEVGRADHGPEIVDEQRLHVRHPRRVLEDAHAGVEHLPVHPPASQ